MYDILACVDNDGILVLQMDRFLAVHAERSLMVGSHCDFYLRTLMQNDGAIDGRIGPPAASA
jgi:hypothetical protein